MTYPSNSYEEFVQNVRLYRCSDVIAHCGIASSLSPAGELDSSGRPIEFLSHALAGISKASLCYGESGQRRLGLKELRNLVRMFNNIEDPFLKDGDIASWVVRVSHEQFPYQDPPFWDLARTRALFVSAAEDAEQSVITPDFWENLLGCSLDHFFGISLLLWASARNNRGKFNPSWLEEKQFEKLSRVIDVEVVRNVFQRQFVISQEDFAEEANRHQRGNTYSERWHYNPIRSAPFVQVGSSVPIAPVARAVMFRPTPGSLYYSAIKAHGTKFSDALGLVFETYLTKQLETCNADVLAIDRPYGNGKKAVDFILVFEDLVLLIEAKATPLRYDSKVGGSSMQDDFDRAPGKGMSQIENTAALIKGKHPAFQDIPHDKNILGLVVTLEPYYAFTSELAFPPTSGKIPKWQICSNDLEHMLAFEGKSLAELMCELNSGIHGDNGIVGLLRANQGGRNSVLDEAWRAYPFSESDELEL